jgi:mRNA interferase YafQ
MRVIKRHKLFLKDIGKCLLTDKHFTKLVTYLALLAQGQPLPEEAKDHALIGNLASFREFHISGDVLVIYQKTDTDLTLVRMGSHSQLFE